MLPQQISKKYLTNCFRNRLFVRPIPARIGKTPAAVQDFAKGQGLFPYLAGHLAVYGFAFVLPLFLILAANIIGLVLYIRRTTKKEKVTVSDLSDEEKEALKKELLKDLQK